MWEECHWASADPRSPAGCLSTEALSFRPDPTGSARSGHTNALPPIALNGLSVFTNVGVDLRKACLPSFAIETIAA